MVIVKNAVLQSASLTKTVSPPNRNGGLKRIAMVVERVSRSGFWLSNGFVRPYITATDSVHHSVNVVHQSVKTVHHCHIHRVTLRFQ